MLKFIRERIEDYDVNCFVNELSQASKYLGMLEAKIDAYKFNSILVPMLQKKEAVSSMYIEGTQTTIDDVLKNEVDPKGDESRISIEVRNHRKTLLYGSDYLNNENFTNSFMKKLHEFMMTGIISEASRDTLGKYKIRDNRIENSAGTVVYVPPTSAETKKYMDELIDFMNCTSDGINPLIKAAIIHSQFESIHPFSDGNGRVGRILVSLYLYKVKVINFPFFYFSEAISQDKNVYYNMLTDSRGNSYNEWMKYFLKKIVIQTQKHINYIDSLNDLYQCTRFVVKSSINSPKYEDIIECLFIHPILSAEFLGDRLTVSRGQAVRYLNTLEEKGILQGDDRKRGRMFKFGDLINLANGV